MSIPYNPEFFLKQGTDKHNIPDSGFLWWEDRWKEMSMSNPLILTSGGFTDVPFITMLHKPHRLQVNYICVHQTPYNLANSLIGKYINIP